MSQTEYFDHPLSIRCSTPGFRRAGVSHPAGPTEYPAGHFTVEQFKQLDEEPRLALQILEGTEPESEADSGEQAQGVLDDDPLAGALIPEEKLAELTAHIAQLDTEKADLWMEGGKPKASAMPSGTSADERDAAWVAYQGMAPDADEQPASTEAGE